MIIFILILSCHCTYITNDNRYDLNIIFVAIKFYVNQHGGDRVQEWWRTSGIIFDKEKGFILIYLTT